MATLFPAKLRGLGLLIVLLLGICSGGAQLAANPISSDFTYQGRLLVGGSPANGNYDFAVRWYYRNQLFFLLEIPTSQTLSNVPVSNGLFTLRLAGNQLTDNPGRQLFLRFFVRPAGTSRFTQLSPNQELLPVPVARSLVPGAIISPQDRDGDLFSTLEVRNDAEYTGNYLNPTTLHVKMTNEDGAGNSASSAIKARNDRPDAIGIFAEGARSAIFAASWEGQESSDATIYATNLSANGKVAELRGNVNITGNLSKAGGSFRIDHPLDPANKYLAHSFVESPDMLNVYNGNVITDAHGRAEIELPNYFEALNQDFRYQLTPIGGPAQVWVAEEISGNRFVIGSLPANTKVSWQVTGIRKDAWAETHRIKVETEKTGDERGKYLHPAEHNQPRHKAIGSANDHLTSAPLKK